MRTFKFKRSRWKPQIKKLIQNTKNKKSISTTRFQWKLEIARSDPKSIRDKQLFKMPSVTSPRKRFILKRQKFLLPYLTQNHFWVQIWFQVRTAKFTHSGMSTRVIKKSSWISTHQTAAQGSKDKRDWVHPKNCHGFLPTLRLISSNAGTTHSCQRFPRHPSLFVADLKKVGKTWETNHKA